jgi:hypothetical protein
VITVEKASKPTGYWKDIANQKAFFDKLAEKWNINKPEDWSKVTTAMVKEAGASFLAKHYNGSWIKGI